MILKKKLTLLIFFVFAFQISVSAQKIKVKKGIAYVNKTAFCKVEKEGNLTNKNYTISNLENDELIFIKSIEPQFFYEVRFLDSGLKMTVKQAPLTNFSKSFIKKIVKSKLIKKGEIDKSALGKFMVKYTDEIPKPLENNSTVIVINGANNSNYEKITRDITKPIYVYGNRIQQDFKTISVMDSNFNSSTFYIGSTKSIKVASVTFNNEGTKSSAILKTSIDNKIRTLTVSFVNRNKEIAQFLVRNNYL